MNDNLVTALNTSPFASMNISQNSANSLPVGYSQYNSNSTNGSISALNSLISRKDFQTIINCDRLFLTLFCKIFSEKNMHLGRDDFDAVAHNDTYYMKGREVNYPGYTCEKYGSIRRELEIFRKLIQKTFKEKKEVERLIICMASDLFIRKPSQEPIYLADWLHNNKDKVSRDMHNAYVSPHLRILLESIGVNYSERMITCSVRTGLGSIEQGKVLAISIKLKDQEYFSYPITPAQVPTTHCAGSEFYKFYQEGRFCDYTIISTDQKAIPIHANVLGIYGGKYFETFLSQKNMLESKTNQSSLHGSHATLSLFVDYLYLGAEQLEKRFLNGEEMDLYELLQIAHTYQLNALFKHVVNLLILAATPNDHQIIQELAKLYQDNDLQRLADYLTK